MGYLPTPPQQARRLYRLFVFLLLIMVAFSAILSAAQKDPGNGSWDLNHETTFDGILYATPYPMLLVKSDSSNRLILLVNEGKHGATDATAGLDRRLVRVTGHLLQRDNRLLLELSSPIQQIQPELQPPLAFSPPEPVTLTGEIIDPKCYSGAMKPGQGKTHKACAALCLRGGIPPMLLTSDGRRLLLVDEHGGGLSGELLEQTIALVGETITITSESSDSSGLSILKLTAHGIRRSKT